MDNIFDYSLFLKINLEKHSLKFKLSFFQFRLFNLIAEKHLQF